MEKPIGSTNLINSDGIILSITPVITKKLYFWTISGVTTYLHLFDRIDLPPDLTNPKWSLVIPAGNSATLYDYSITFDNGLVAALSSDPTQLIKIVTPSLYLKGIVADL